MTWFERIKACQTPEEMEVILDTDKRGFCPGNAADSTGRCGYPGRCGTCIIEWLRAETR